MYCQYDSHDTNTLNLMEDALHCFHHTKWVFLQYRAGKRLTAEARDNISKKFNLPPGHLIYLMPRMSKIVTRIQAAPVTHLVPPGAPSWHPISSETFCD